MLERAVEEHPVEVAVDLDVTLDFDLIQWKLAEHSRGFNSMGDLGHAPINLTQWNVVRTV